MYGCVLGVDVGIDAQADRRALARARPRPRRGASSSSLGFDVEAQDAGARARARISAAVLPTPENTILRGSPPAAMHARELAARHDVEAAARAARTGRAREIGVRLDRVADEMVACRERRVEAAVSVRQRRARIDVARRAELRGDARRAARLRRAARPRDRRKGSLRFRHRRRFGRCRTLRAGRRSDHPSRSPGRPNLLGQVEQGPSCPQPLRRTLAVRRIGNRRMYWRKSRLRRFTGAQVKTGAASDGDALTQRGNGANLSFS